MGKYIIFTTLALAAATTLIANQGMQTDLDTSEQQAERQEKVLARQIATSAFEMAMSELKRDFQNWRVQRSDVSYDGGTFDLTATGSSSGPVSITSVGHFGDESYEITAEGELDEVVNGMYHAITAKSDMDFSVAGGGCSGGPCVSGLDDGGDEDRHGINLWASDDAGDNEEDVCNEFGDEVEGRGTGCDVVSRDEDRDSEVVGQMDQLKSAIESLPSSDKTVCEADGGGNCTLAGAQSGDGIYYVKGDLTITGNADWDGIVYVADGGSITINGGGGTENISGSLLMEGNTDFTMHGGNRIQYNSEEILNLMNKLPSVANETTQIVDRSGGFVSGDS